MRPMINAIYLLFVMQTFNIILFSHGTFDEFDLHIRIVLQ